MKIKSLIVFLILFLFGCSNNKPKDEKLVTVQEEREYLQKYGTSLSLGEVIEIARDRNLDLRIKRLETEIASLDRKIAFGNFLPSITLGANYTKLDDPINLEMGLPSLPPLPPTLPLPPQVGGLLSKLPKSIETKLVDESFQTVGIAAQIPIFVPSTWYLYSARKKGEDISKLAESFADKMLQLQVMSEYFYILALESERETLINNLKSSEELERKAEVSLKVEGILDWELKKVQTLVESQKISLNKNERELKIAKMKLKRTLNLNLQEDIVLEKIDTKVVELPSLEECVYNSLNGNELLKIREKGKEINTDIKKIAITNFLPKIILGGGYLNNSNSTLADPDFLFGHVSGVLSIFNGFKNVNEYKKAVRREKIGELTLEKQFMTTVLEVTRAYDNVETAQEFLNMAEKNYQAEMGRLKQKSAEKRVEMIGEEEYYKALAEYNTALSLKEKAQYQYEMAYGALSIAMGNNPLRGGK